MKRVCIYPKDVSMLTGKSLRHAQKMIQDLKLLLNRNRDQFVTMEEFSNYSGIDLELIVKVCA